MRSEGDLLMDAPRTKSWRELKTHIMNKDYWRVRARVRVMKQSRVTVDIGEHLEEGETLSFTVSN